jgi:predicted RNA-binding protein YlxR (DUF448 family)
MAKTIPTRQCIGCGEKKEKTELIRIVRVSEGDYEIDLTGRKNGRGAYLCKNPECLEKAFRKKGLERSFKEAVPAETMEKLKGELING